MNAVNQTLYIPLYSKAFVSRHGLFLNDKWAEKIWDAEGFKLKGKSKSKWLAYYMGIRAAVFDGWLKEKISNAKDATVLHIGCGMDSRIMRVGESSGKWYDVDFPEVIEERKRYYTGSESYKMIPADVRNNDWLTNIPEQKAAIVVMEGVSMYLTPEELNELTAGLCSHFEQVTFLVDCYTVLAAKMSKYKNPINDVGVTKVYGIDDPKVLQHGGLNFIKEHNMTPMKYIDELSGIEKHIFKKLYAGSFSKRLYRLFEYKKD